MVDTVQAQALLMARAATSALLMGDDEALGVVLSEEDPELMRSCCATLTAMLAGQVLVNACEKNRDPLEFWTSSVQGQMRRLGR